MCECGTVFLKEPSRASGAEEHAEGKSAGFVAEGILCVEVATYGNLLYLCASHLGQVRAGALEPSACP